MKPVSAFLLFIVAAVMGAVAGFLVLGLIGAGIGFFIVLAIAVHRAAYILVFRALRAGAWLALPVFIIGTIGPLILSESNLGPLIGFLAAPVAFCVGSVAGFIYYTRRALAASEGEKIAYFTTFAVFVGLSLERWSHLVERV